MTAKRPNKPQRLSTLPATLTFNDYSDYEGAPESSDFRALPHRLSTLRLFPSDFGAGRHTHPEALADRSGQHPKKSPGPNRTRPDQTGHARTKPDTPGPNRTRPDRLRPCLDPDRPGRPPKAPRREHRRKDIQAQPPRERPTEGHGRRHTRKRIGRKGNTQAQESRRAKEK